MKNVLWNPLGFLLFCLMIGVSLLACTVPSTMAAESNSQSFTFRAVWFDEGNVVLSGGYGLEVCVINGGTFPNKALYKINIPESGTYALSILYAAQVPRPIQVKWDDAESVTAAGKATGDWDTKTAIWEKITDLTIKPGEHLLSLQSKNCFPHIVALRLEPQFKMTASWQLPRSIVRNALSKPFPTVAPKDWFYEVAADRAAKRESGETFEKHFGRETVTALVPKEELTFTIRDLPTDVTTNLLDERTYKPNMFATGTSDDKTQFTVEVSRKITEQDGNTYLLATPESYTISVTRYQLLLDKSEQLLARLIDTFGEEEVAGAFGKGFDGLASQFATQKKALDAWRSKLSSNPTNEHKLAFVQEFFDSIRLYSCLGRANPLLDFDNLLYVRRSKNHNGLVNNWVSNSALPKNAFDDTLCRLKLDATAKFPVKSDVVFRPDHPAFVGDVDLHFDADRLLFSSTNKEGQWNIYETKLTESDGHLNGSPAKELLPWLPEANAYDGCYLPDDSIMYTSSACYISVPCVNGGTRVTNIYRQYNDEKKTNRRLTFDQEHNWCPVVMADGRVLYQRWEYTDVPHAHARLLFLMNPDGTNQGSFYGSNSYWPNSMFYARPIPEEPTKFVAIVGGHHGVTRMGEMVLFDVRQGRKETQGAVQRICAKEREVKSRTNPKYDDTLIVDCLVNEAWPKFLHPWPLSSNYYLASASMSAGDEWGIYLVDTDDNMILLSKEKGFSHMEPIPLRKTSRPPVIADRIDESKSDATVFLADIYVGDGLKNVPRGTVKSLRLFTYNYLFPHMGGPQGAVGAEGPWDIRNMIGTVPVEPNGSALFKVPANTPIAIQPLDENGKELQLMRSWFTAMPGENLSCIGCHEDQNSVSPSSLDPVLVQRMKVKEITPWYGPIRGFSFKEEVQPVLDRYCIACHNGDANAPLASFDLRGLENISGYVSAYHTATNAGRWSTSYNMLHRYVRRPGLESDYHLLMPTEFAAESTDLYRLLVKGHYGVRLDAESWDRLITWIDLNAPYYGYWHEQNNSTNVAHWNGLRRKIMELYKSGTPDQEKKIPANWNPDRAAVTFKTDHNRIPVSPLDPKAVTALAGLEKGKPLPDSKAIRDAALADKGPIPVSHDWSFNTPEAQKRQQDTAERLFGDRNKTSMSLEPIPGLKLEFRLIPAGTFVMGAQSKDAAGKLLHYYADESPCVVEIKRPFWLGTYEITNGQFEQYNLAHDSRVESRYGMQFGVRGFYVNGPELSVVRVSWNEAEAFCKWLSVKSGKSIQLPTEAQWEYACRAGTATPMNYGLLDADFAPHANLADYTLREMICHPYFKDRVLMKGTDFDNWIPRIDKIKDGGFLSEKPGRYAPNAWGLFDMHGNVAEWTASLARPYPWRDDDGRNDLTIKDGERVVRGGSWRDRPVNARSEFRSSYRPWQGIFNVGFRILCEIPE